MGTLQDLGLGWGHFRTSGLGGLLGLGGLPGRLPPSTNARALDAAQYARKGEGSRLVLTDRY